MSCLIYLSGRSSPICVRETYEDVSQAMAPEPTLGPRAGVALTLEDGRPVAIRVLEIAAYHGVA